ncbi:hypothetical protein [Halomonas sp. 25-S5]|uniref:hypothetical protein n=1 Tax=Halomonas sp. 25-S5 TaxID=2994065 RepID=UPI002468F822|nr:hypothetical protein [Halomonas sp. 25-S5]
MKQPKRLQDVFTWLPPQQRVGRFGFPLAHGPSEEKRPVFWLELSGGRKEGELYFINDSQDTLDYVKVEAAGFMTADDDTITLEADGITYHDVLPHEAVKIEEFDGVYDLDIVFQVGLEVKGETYGKMRIRTPPGKGFIPRQELLWDNGQSGKNVVVDRN